MHGGEQYVLRRLWYVRTSSELAAIALLQRVVVFPFGCSSGRGGHNVEVWVATLFPPETVTCASDTGPASERVRQLPAPHDAAGSSRLQQSCTERLRLSTRVRLLEKDYDSAIVALTHVRGHIDEPSYVRRCRDIKRALAEARSAYAAHLRVHGC